MSRRPTIARNRRSRRVHAAMEPPVRPVTGLLRGVQRRARQRALLMCADLRRQARARARLRASAASDSQTMRPSVNRSVFRRVRGASRQPRQGKGRANALTIDRPRVRALPRPPAGPHAVPPAAARHPDCALSARQDAAQPATPVPSASPRALLLRRRRNQSCHRHRRASQTATCASPSCCRNKVFVRDARPIATLRVAGCGQMVCA